MSNDKLTNKVVVTIKQANIIFEIAGLIYEIDDLYFKTLLNNCINCVYIENKNLKIKKFIDEYLILDNTVIIPNELKELLQSLQNTLL